MFASKPSDKIENLVDQSATMLTRATEQAGAIAQRGVDAVRDGSQQLLSSARTASDDTLSYVRKEPIKAMLIAGATGATLMALAQLFRRSRTRD